MGDACDVLYNGRAPAREDDASVEALQGRLRRVRGGMYTIMLIDAALAEATRLIHHWESLTNTAGLNVAVTVIDWRSRRGWDFENPEILSHLNDANKEGLYDAIVAFPPSSTATALPQGKWQALTGEQKEQGLREDRHLFQSRSLTEMAFQ